LACLQRIVDHYPCAPERPGERLAVPGSWVKAVVVPELHEYIILGFMAGHEAIRTGRHCVFLLHVHLVFVTKYRHQVFAVKHLERMEEIMQAVCADFGAQLREFNGEQDHVHLLVNFPPTIAVSRLVNSLKGVSSRRLRQEFPDLRRHYWRAKRLWSGSYFAGSVGGPPISVLRQYIEQQNRPC
jgi:putative transposase